MVIFMLLKVHYFICLDLPLTLVINYIGMSNSNARYRPLANARSIWVALSFTVCFNHYYGDAEWSNHNNMILRFFNTTPFFFREHDASNFSQYPVVRIDEMWNVISRIDWITSVTVRDIMV